MNRQDHSCQEKSKIDKKTWSSPHLLVFGDVRDLTRNIGRTGFGDIKLEGRDCKSPGNCN